MPRGRPSEYLPQYCDQVRRLALLGLTNKEIAAFFEVDESTLENWMVAHPEFLRSLKEGKADADSKIVEKLYYRAMGYSHPDEHISNYQGEITITPITKHYPPDTTAAIFWLKNRQRKLWRNKDDDSSNEGINTVVVDRNGNSSETAE